ncbi:MAG: apolipoprotein N-acyltransferase [Candidatus Aminicenantes bacterium]|nr:apolipoprotein N-acyltransferase [Candidatus Aminicenantes bacterium]
MKIRYKEILLAVTSGVMTALAFPKVEIFYLAWVSLIPLLFVLLRSKPGQSFFFGLVSGFSFYAILLYWIPAVPAHYGGLSTGLSLLIYVLLALLLALVWGLFAFLVSVFFRRFSTLTFFLIPFIWISTEFILTYLFTGFPWGLLGASQYKNIYFIQAATIAGVYGLSFIMVLFQSLLVFSTQQKRKFILIFAALFTVLLFHLGGLLSLKKISNSDHSFTASLIQGNTPASTNFSTQSFPKTFDMFQKHLDLSRQAAHKGAELAIWPELSVPLCFSCDFEPYVGFSKELLHFSQKTETTLLLGTSEISQGPNQTSYYNAAVCVNPQGSLSFYYKKHLVPFGEYTPYKFIFSFISKFTHAIGELTPGKKHELHHFNEIPFGSPICYEIIFPSLVRKFTKMGAEFLVTITNDGWYGTSAAPYQHFALAVLRAVENRRFLLRSATTGISGAIDPYGRIIARSRLHTTTSLNIDVSPQKSLTFYTRHGDVLLWAGLTITLVFLILSLIKRKQ